MDQGKVSVVYEWPNPSTVKEIQKFLGFSSFYCWFIYGFNSIVALLISMLMKGPKKLRWKPSHRKTLCTPQRGIHNGTHSQTSRPTMSFKCGGWCIQTGVRPHCLTILARNPNSILWPFSPRNWTLQNKTIILATDTFLASWNWKSDIIGLNGWCTPLLFWQELGHTNLYITQDSQKAKLMAGRPRSYFFMRFHFTLSYCPG